MVSYQTDGVEMASEASVRKQIELASAQLGAWEAENA